MTSQAVERFEGYKKTPYSLYPPSLHCTRVRTNGIKAMSLGERELVEVVIVILHDLIASNNDLSDLELSFLQKTNNCRIHVLMEQTNSTTFTRFDKF